MTTTDWLLIVVSGFLLLVVIQLYFLTALFKRTAQTFGNAFQMDFSNFYNHNEQIIQSLDATEKYAEEIRSHVEEIAGVMKIIQKYKLPNRQEQKELDEIEFESEHLRRVSEALNKNKN